MANHISDSSGSELIVGESNMLQELPSGTQTDVICQHMDITDSLNSLRAVLESKLLFNLQDYQFYLQDSTLLEGTKNLVDQCVQGDGIVQVNVEISNKNGVKKINIVDVLKPADDVVTLSPGHDIIDEETNNMTIDASVPPANSTIAASDSSYNIDNSTSNTTGSSQAGKSSPQQQVTRWVISQQFKNIMERERIPTNPIDWQPVHTQIWFNWAAKEFSLCEDASLWNLSGKQLLGLSHQEFTEKIKYDYGDIFWTHLELLRKCKFVAVVQSESLPSSQPKSQHKVKMDKTIIGKTASIRGKANKATKNASAAHRLMPAASGSSDPASSSGQTQLWQFLLELLTDKDCREYIQWVGDQGEFRLNNPEMVAQMWGLRKNKPTMNYEKLSRALRYYYDGDMISKVSGKRFVYKFVCDLKQLIGYSAEELNNLVIEAEQRKIAMANLNPNASGAIEIGPLS